MCRQLRLSDSQKQLFTQKFQSKEQKATSSKKEAKNRKAAQRFPKQAFPEKKFRHISQEVSTPTATVRPQEPRINLGQIGLDQQLIVTFRFNPGMNFTLKDRITCGEREREGLLGLGLAEELFVEDVTGMIRDTDIPCGRRGGGGGGDHRSFHSPAETDRRPASGSGDVFFFFLLFSIFFLGRRLFFLKSFSFFFLRILSL